MLRSISTHLGDEENLLALSTSVASARPTLLVPTTGGGGATGRCLLAETHRL